MRRTRLHPGTRPRTGLGITTTYGSYCNEGDSPYCAYHRDASVRVCRLLRALVDDVEEFFFGAKAACSRLGVRCNGWRRSSGLRSSLPVQSSRPTVSARGLGGISVQELAVDSAVRSVGVWCGGVDITASQGSAAAPFDLGSQNAEADPAGWYQGRGSSP